MSNTSTLTAPTATVEVPLVKTSTKEIKAKIDRLREVRAIKTAAEAESKALSAEIIEFAGLAKAINWGKTKLASIVDSHSTSMDFKGFAQAYPDLYDQFVTVKPYKQVR